MSDGGEEFDFAMTVSQATGNAKAIPAASLIIARPDIVGAAGAATGTYTGTQGTTHHVYDLSGTTDKYMTQGGCSVSSMEARPPGSSRA